MSAYETTGSFFKDRIEETPPDFSDLTPPFPKVCLVELTNACNQACVFCANPRMKRKLAYLDPELFHRFVREGVDLGIREMGFYTTGEPLMSPKLEEFVRVAKGAGVEYSYITTNGALGTPEKFRRLVAAGLDSFKFSINAATRETYRRIHLSDDFDKVLENVRWLHAFRKENDLRFRILGSCILTRENHDEKPAHSELFGQYFDDILYVEADGQQGQSIDQAADALGHRLSFPPEGSVGPCAFLWNRVHLTAEGYLTLCCVDYENNLTYASLSEGGSLLSHWHNAVIREMRRRHLDQSLEGTLCHKCLYGKGKVTPLADH